MLTITAPVAYEVIQQNNAGVAMLVVAGTYVDTTVYAAAPAPVTSVTATLTPVRGGKATVATLPLVDGGRFSGLVRVPTGWYTLLLTAGPHRATVARVGVGEVFVVAGHSVAQGDGTYTLDGSTDERVVTIPVDKTSNAYPSSGNPMLLPRQFAPFTSGVYPGPFGSNTHFWAKFGQQVAQTLDCPVAVFNAAFGGTSLRHWALSATGGQFEHGFVNSAKGFPYVNLKNALSQYVGQTGCRAVLMDQGQNDHEQADAGVIFADYKTLVDQLRADSRLPRLAVVVNRQTPYRVRTAVRQAQQRMIDEVPDCYAGPDYDSLTDSDRYDGVHLGISGQEKAAQWWAGVVCETAFRSRAKPYQPNAVPVVPVEESRRALLDAQPEATVPLTSLNLTFVLGAGVMALLILVGWLVANRVRPTQLIR